MDQIDLSELNLSEKEKKILESAISIFSAKGFNGTTTSEIAKKAGVAEGTIFRYFKSKKDILSSILVHLINLISSKIALHNIEELAKEAESKDMRWFLKELIKDRMSLVSSLFPMLRVILTEATYREEIRATLYKSVIVPANNMFNHLYGLMIEKGQVRSDLPAEVIFKSIIANIATLIFQKALFPEHFPNEEIDHQIEMTIDIILTGIEKKGVK